MIRYLAILLLAGCSLNSGDGPNSKVEISGKYYPIKGLCLANAYADPLKAEFVAKCAIGF